jgi:cytochrome c oxidase cbb3-type subunit 3
MKAVLVGIVVVALAGGASLRDLNAAPLEIDLERGKAIYSSVCAICHGADGKGGQTKFNPPAADLTSPAIQGRLDVSLLKSVHDGKPNTEMGAWGEALSKYDIRDVLAYVRTLAPKGADGMGSGLR